jgi:protein-S-isoprenylcysteine O-methyltransferase Ste14
MNTAFQGRGEGWVIAQFVLLAIIILTPPSLGGAPLLAAWTIPIGFLVGLAGIAVAYAGIRGLGTNLTAFPKPKDDAALVQTGIYAFVRHPIYTGMCLLALGIALGRQSIPTLIEAVLLLLFFEFKARREEHWLVAKFPEYDDYRQRVRGRIIPG